MKRLLLCLLAFSCALSVCSKVVKIEADEPFEFKGPDGNKYKYILVGDGNGGLCAAVVQRSVFKDRYGNLRHEEERWTHHQAKPYGYESIVIPDTVKYKGSDFVVRVICPFAFRYEENLKNITLPKTINAIHDCPFYSRGVLNIHISDMTTWLNLKDTYPMPDHRLYVNGKLVTHLVIPEGMTGKAIGWQFSCNVALESVILPNSMKDQTPIFDGCKNLREVVFPERLKNIWVYSFRYCKSLKRIVIPASVEKIGKEAFNGCDNLESVEFLDPIVAIEKDAFKSCDKLKDIKGLSGQSKIDPSAFSGGTPFSLEEFQKTFSYYATSKIPQIIRAWQKKGEFETTEQWHSRVTVATREAKVKEETEKAKQEYIEKHWKVEPVATIGIYNADQGVFPITIAGERVYVKVPQSEAQEFKINFKPSYIHTDYDIVNDHIAVVGRTCKVGDKIYQTTNQYAKADNLNNLALNLPPLEMNFGGATATTSSKPKTPTDLTIDQNIPASGITNSNTFAVIIGNEDYEHVAKVAYAKNDARVFAEYCRKTLGIPAKNVRGYENATYGKLLSAVQDIKDIAKAYNGDINVIFYYAGHGMPYGSQGEAYLLPVDADGRQINICYSLSKLYEELGALNAKSVTVLMDACFSGAQRGDGMLMAARGVALKPKVNAPRGNMVVMTAANGEQTAYPFAEKGHGMFTYYLLKKLRDTKGDCTLGELGNYIKTEVAKQAIVTNGREQTPALLVSPNISGNWQMMKLK